MLIKHKQIHKLFLVHESCHKKEKKNKIKKEDVFSGEVMNVSAQLLSF